MVLLRALESRNSVNNHEGKVAIGFLVVEALVMVVALVPLPPIASALNSAEGMTGDAIFRLLSRTLQQIGEFSFILATMGQHLGLLDDLARNLILAGAILSIAINPMLFSFNDRVSAALENNHHLQGLNNRWIDPLASIPENTPPAQLRRQVVLVGYGSIGSRIVDKLKQTRTPLVVVDQNRERIEQLRNQGVQAVAGDAADPATLIQAHIVHASTLLIALPDIVGLTRIVDTACALNPDIHILVRVHSTAEADAVRHDHRVEFVNAKDALAQDLIARIGMDQMVQQPPAKHPPKEGSDQASHIQSG